ncbi:MAG TPA: alpha/beta fold hydrolase [Deinococcales bacterium]|nr:alpha/beta fold hydrolase [Deinococcales bacterium]
MIAATIATTIALTLSTPTGKLHGSLELPNTAGARVPVVLLVPGSGPDDRDGNTPLLPAKLDEYKLLAEGLAAHGIASLRYDKRGIGESAPAIQPYQSLGLGRYFVDQYHDVAGWIALLKKDPVFTGVAVVGHSEGSLVGMLAQQVTPADAFISLDGIGENVHDTLIRQLTPGLPADLMAKMRVVLDANLAGHEAAPDPDLMKIPALASISAQQAYMIEWMKHDPSQEIAKLNVPTLVIQGQYDTQVTMADAEKLAAARPGIQLQVIPNMTHVLKAADATPESQQATYTTGGLPLAPGLVEAIAEFVKATIK